MKRRMRRKILAILTTVAMVLSLAPSALAGPFSDVPDNASYAAAVNRLAGLGVLQGVGGGKYDPESTYTRAQFAALVTKLLGYQAAADASKGMTDFKDVPADHWATGFINVATSLGIVKGYGDGTFKPNKPVTHAEALTMLVRALGYEPTLKGRWPANVLVKAAALGLTKGVTVVANLPASRGEVAVFADNSLGVDLMVEVAAEGGNIRYEVQKGKTILTERLKASSIEGTLTGSPEYLQSNADEVTVGGTTKKLVAGTKYSGLLGHKVKAYLNSDDKVFFIEDKSADKVKVAKVSQVSGAVYELKVGTEKLQVAATVYRTLNYAAWTQVTSSPSDDTVTDAALASVDNGEVTVVLNDSGEVERIIAVKSTVKIADSVSTSLQSITFTSDLGVESLSLSLKDKTVTWSGAAAKLEDVQKHDVIEYVEGTAADGKKRVNIVVTRNVKSGTLDRLVGSDKVRLAGTDYERSSSSVTMPGTSHLGKTISLYLNKHGKFVLFKAGTVTSGQPEPAKPVALVKTDPYDVTTAGGTKTYVKVLKSDGTEAYWEVNDGAGVTTVSGNVYTFDYDANHKAATLQGWDVVTKAVIEYELTNDGKLNTIKVLAKPAYTNTVTYKKDPNRVTVGGATYAVTSETVAFDVSGATYKTLALTTLSDNTSVNSSKVVPDGAKARVVVVGSSVSGAADHYGLVMDKYVVSGPKYMFDIMENGATTAYEVDKTAAYDVYNADNVVRFTVAGSKAESVAAPTQVTVTDNVYKTLKIKSIDATNKIIEVAAYNADNVEKPGSATTKLVDAKTQYFNLNGDNPATQVQFSDLAVGQEVRVYLDASDTSIAKVIVIVQ